jgi:S-disulfanyl-L-cysteine oxidoreductase SoxD
MSNFLKSLASTALGIVLLYCFQERASAQSPYPGIGRAATAKELKAWDIDVRPDFKGLPPGSGSVAKGQDIWEAKCASCHGVFGESNEVFTPLAGGTTKDDVRNGRVARLQDDSFPSRTTLMKLSSISTLWDYINRAMPWTQPKSLTPDEVYAVTAFMLNLGDIVPDNFVLSNINIEQTQQLMPNRYGMSTSHAMWPGKLKGSQRQRNLSRVDYQGSACMKDCRAEAKVASFLPEFARDAHGNLADQNRLVGAQKGAITSTSAFAARTSTDEPSSEIRSLLAKQNCLACHGLDSKLVGPGLADVTKKYRGQADAVDYLASRIKAGGSGVWGSIPMPAQSLSDDDAKMIASWLVTSAGPSATPLKGKP